MTNKSVIVWVVIIAIGIWLCTDLKQWMDRGYNLFSSPFTPQTSPNLSSLVSSLDLNDVMKNTQ